MLQPTTLTCENLHDPLGIDELRPRLAWQLAPLNLSARAQKQSAYQILVASTLERLHDDEGDLWSSGKVESDQSIHVEYAGKPMDSGQDYWWKVRVWDQDGEPSPWSHAARWSMGLLVPADWGDAKWIGIDRENETDAALKTIDGASWLQVGDDLPDTKVSCAQTWTFRRTLDLCRLGSVDHSQFTFVGDHCECVLMINGRQVVSTYTHLSLLSIDTACFLVEGINTIELTVRKSSGENPPPRRVLGVLDVKSNSGVCKRVVTDANWDCTVNTDIGVEDRPVRITNIYDTQHDHEEVVVENRRLPARYLRREFNVDRPIKRAMAYVCGLGFFDLHLNGQKLNGADVMNPSLTNYTKRCLYRTFDLTAHLQAGRHTIGMVLGNGRFYAPRIRVPAPTTTFGTPRLLFRLEIEYQDQSSQVIVSDRTFNATDHGPIQSNNEYDGEEYDARLEMPGWDQSQFEAGDWQHADELPAPGGQLEAQMVEPVRVIERLRPHAITNPRSGVYLIDFGQAFYGVPEIHVQGPRGTRVEIRSSFEIDDRGLLLTHSDRSARNADVYVLNGEGLEIWHPRFKGASTRWLQVRGFPGTPTLENFVGCVIHTDMKQVGRFDCSNNLINRIFSCTRWSTRIQNRSVPMEGDRDERMPWTGHPAKTSQSEGYVFDVHTFYRDWLKSIRADQDEQGTYQEVMPGFWTFTSKGVIWPALNIILPLWLYETYGDRRAVEENYPAAQRWMIYHTTHNQCADGTINLLEYGDWVDASTMDDSNLDHAHGATSRSLVANAYYCHCLRLMARTANLLNKKDDAEYFSGFADRARHGFLDRFFEHEQNRFESETQCSFVLPLAFDLVPQKNRQAVIDNLVDTIMQRDGGHTSVGLVGMQWQMQTLSQIGHPEVAYHIATRTERPSWGYMVANDATTTWERWDADTQDGGMNSRCQKILSGNLEAWFFQTLAGIQHDPQQPGFKRLILHPILMSDLAWVRASYKSPYGIIRSSWSRNGDQFVWHCTVPVNTTALIHLPTNDPESITESGLPVRNRLAVTATDSTVFEVGSGTYTWRCVPHVIDSDFRVKSTLKHYAEMVTQNDEP